MTISADDPRHALDHQALDHPAGTTSLHLSHLRHQTVRVASLFRRHIDAIRRVTKIIELRRPIVSRSVRNPPPLGLALDSLANLAELQETVSSHTAEVVAIARAAGATWNQIGDALGVSRQAAHERYRRLPQAFAVEERSGA